jgi:hypothetical protein
MRMIACTITALSTIRLFSISKRKVRLKTRTIALPNCSATWQMPGGIPFGMVPGVWP